MANMKNSFKKKQITRSKRAAREILKKEKLLRDSKEEMSRTQEA
jgi:hypothetical protein